jgi:DNA-binding transcriptional ArsR family regulator
MDEVFRALADPSRRELLDSLDARNGQTLRELCAGLDMARQSSESTSPSSRRPTW